MYMPKSSCLSVMLVLQAKYHCFYGLLFDTEFLSGFVVSIFPDIWWKDTCDVPNHCYSSNQFFHLKIKCHKGNILRKSNIESD